MILDPSQLLEMEFLVVQLAAGEYIVLEMAYWVVGPVVEENQSVLAVQMSPHPPNLRLHCFLHQSVESLVFQILVFQSIRMIGHAEYFYHDDISETHDRCSNILDHSGGKVPELISQCTVSPWARFKPHPAN